MTLYRRVEPLDPPPDDGFKISYVPDDGAEHRVQLTRGLVRLYGD